ncbi:hypothetical protein HGRIS_009801 [Hohenbuehelia grisea]|uniref:CAF17 C-terminal domain-containing protein n=1 Tax=Hohenbuehelia grisea TaxID=104357 RepID=A0ABR3J291_9AGAR
MLPTSTFLSTPTLAPILNRAILSVTGSQASQFLNGLLAASVPDSPPRPFYSAFLNPQGRVHCDVFVYTTEDTTTGKTGYLLEYDSSLSKPYPTAESGLIPPLLSLLKQHVLRSKVKLRDVSEEYKVYATWGAEVDNAFEHLRPWHYAKSGVIEPMWPKDRWPWGSEYEMILDRRSSGMGQRKLIKSSQSLSSNDHDLGEPSAYLAHRIAHGVPEGIDDITPHAAFPMDCNLDIMGGLDFRKGCYVGQELTVRTYHTGMVRKRIFPVMLQGSRPPPRTDGFTEIKATIKQSDEDGQRKPRPRGTGKLLSTSQSSGLALLRLEHVAGVDRGDVQLNFEDPEGGLRSVTPWWPPWWPRKPWEGSE